MKSKRLLLLVSLATLVFAAGQANAQTQYIKYKNYLIPLVSEEPEEPEEPEDTTPNVYYIDDVDDSRSRDVDPNGVYEIPIVVGWHELGYYNLVGVGVAGKVDESFVFDTNFVQDLLDMTGVGDTLQALSGVSLKESIVETALSLGSISNPLVIVVGGSREIALEALNYAENQGTPINDIVRVIGVQNCNETTSPVLTNCTAGLDDEIDPAIETKLGNSFHNISCDPNSSKSCRAFYNKTIPLSLAKDVDMKNNTKWLSLEDWYEQVYGATEIGHFIMTSEKNNKTIESSLDGDLVKIADFTALAYLIWNNDAWSTEDGFNMYEKIAEGMRELP